MKRWARLALAIAKLLVTPALSVLFVTAEIGPYWLNVIGVIGLGFWLGHRSVQNEREQERRDREAQELRDRWELIIRRTQHLQGESCEKSSS